MSAKKKSYSSKPRRELVEIDGEEYEIVQMTGVQTEEWRESLSSRYDAMEEDESKVRLVRQQGMNADLIVRCLYPVKVPPGQPRAPVTREVVNTWSNECCDDVYDDCQRVNGFTKEATDEAKKDSTTLNASTGTLSPTESSQG